MESAPQLPVLQPAKDSPEDWLLPAASMATSAPSGGMLPGGFDAHTKQQQPQPQRLDRQHSLQRLQQEQQRRAPTPPSVAPSRASTPGAAQQEPPHVPQAHLEQRQEAGHDPMADLLGCDWLLDPEAVAADARTLNSEPPLLPVKVG